MSDRSNVTKVNSMFGWLMAGIAWIAILICGFFTLLFGSLLVFAKFQQETTDNDIRKFSYMTIIPAIVGALFYLYFIADWSSRDTSKEKFVDQRSFEDMVKSIHITAADFALKCSIEGQPLYIINSYSAQNAINKSVFSNAVREMFRITLGKSRTDLCIASQSYDEGSFEYNLGIQNFGGGSGCTYNGSDVISINRTTLAARWAQTHEWGNNYVDLGICEKVGEAEIKHIFQDILVPWDAQIRKGNDNDIQQQANERAKRKI